MSPGGGFEETDREKVERMIVNKKHITNELKEVREQVHNIEQKFHGVYNIQSLKHS